VTTDLPLTLQGALTAGERGELHVWLQRFLRSPESLNISLADYLDNAVGEYEGPIVVPLASVVRITGPEPKAVLGPWGGVDPATWEPDIARMVTGLEGGWEPTPLVASKEHRFLSDGNHRHEALRRSGRVEYWTILITHQ
jgi:hypothetical protein